MKKTTRKSRLSRLWNLMSTDVLTVVKWLNVKKVHLVTASTACWELTWSVQQEQRRVWGYQTGTCHSCFIELNTSGKPQHVVTSHKHPSAHLTSTLIGIRSDEPLATSVGIRWANLYSSTPQLHAVSWLVLHRGTLHILLSNQNGHFYMRFACSANLCIRIYPAWRVLLRTQGF